MLIFIVLILFFLPPKVGAEIYRVPSDFPTISTALDATAANDTVWVRQGIYQDRLIFPAHDVVILSDYFMLNDPAARDCTIIDASLFADEDTSSVLIFVHGNTRATFVGGFTLTGGHGTISWGGTRQGGGIYLDNSSPMIHSCRITGNELGWGTSSFIFHSDVGSPGFSHCEIDGNCGHMSPMVISNNHFNEEPALFEWNDVHDNYACNSPAPYIIGATLGGSYAKYVVRYNHFHDYQGSGALGLFFFRSEADVCGNVFERLSVGDGAEGAWIITSTSFANPFRDNLFRDCHLSDGRCIDLAPVDYHYRSLIERNWFENIVNDTIGPACLYIQNPNAEVRENVFLNCRGPVGPVQLSQSPPRGCEVIFERNHFFYNQATVGDLGSAFNTVGAGPFCTFANNWFEGNEGFAVHTTLPDSIEADMSNNYWGDPSGPFHPVENPGGLGDSVPANVHVTPWLTSPPGMNQTMEERLSLKPEEWSLESAYPNPFNAVINLRLTSIKPQPFEVTAYNTLGQRVAQVWQGIVPKDTPTTVLWNATGDRGACVASGIYYLVVCPRGPGARAPKSMKVILLR